jgi:hypothetical protein
MSSGLCPIANSVSELLARSIRQRFGKGTRFRFYYDFIDCAGDFQTGNLFAADARAAERAARAELRLYERFDRLHPDWDLIRFPNGRFIRRAEFERTFGSAVSQLATSPYLNRPIRSLDQARADLERRS